MTVTDKRRAAFRRGLSAEARAEALLAGKGLMVAARRLRTPVGEIDIIARGDNLLVFCEVKARAEPRTAAEAVTLRQRRRVAAAARAWLAENPVDPACDIRFDVVLVTPGGSPIHLPGAFDDSE